MRNLIRVMLFVLIPFNLFAPNLSQNQIEANYRLFIIEQQNKRLYEQVIENIKELEEKRLKAYYCPSGHPTIGYGHLIKRGEYFNTLTNKQADSLLRVDFNTRLNYIDTSLSYNKRLALAHFVFNVGIGNYSKSTLNKKVKAGISIDTEIVKWNKYRKNGILTTSKHLSKARAFELEIYKVNEEFSVINSSNGNKSTYSKELSFIRTNYKLYPSRVHSLPAS